MHEPRSGTRTRLTCSSCEATIVGAPVIHVGLAFCCDGCVVGGPCVCSYDAVAEPADEPAPRELVAIGRSRPTPIETPILVGWNPDRPSPPLPEAPRSPRRHCISSGTASTPRR